MRFFSTTSSIQPAESLSINHTPNGLLCLGLGGAVCFLLLKSKVSPLFALESNNRILDATIDLINLSRTAFIPPVVILRTAASHLRQSIKSSSQSNTLLPQSINTLPRWTNRLMKIYIYHLSIYIISQAIYSLLSNYDPFEFNSRRLWYSNFFYFLQAGLIFLLLVLNALKLIYSESNLDIVISFLPLLASVYDFSTKYIPASNYISNCNMFIRSDVYKDCIVHRGTDLFQFEDQTVKPRLLWLQASREADHNGAFERSFMKGFWKKFSEYYDIKHEYISSPNDICLSLANSPSVDQLIIAAHANENSMRLGINDDGWLHNLNCSSSDIKKVRKSVSLFGCNAGAGSLIASIASTFRGREVCGPTEKPIFPLTVATERGFNFFLSNSKANIIVGYLSYVLSIISGKENVFGNTRLIYDHTRCITHTP